MRANRNMTAQRIPIHTPALFEAAVERASRLLRAGGVIALPTETVYGLAANALNPAAVSKIFKLKGRPPTNPIIVHLASWRWVDQCAAFWPPEAGLLAEAFWPGPLTMILSRASCIPDAVTGGSGTVGLRWPNHPFLQAVIRRCGFPLAAPSANISSQLSPTLADHVQLQLGDRLALIVDGGPSGVGIESTVVDLTGPVPEILRPGMIALEDLRDRIPSCRMRPSGTHRRGTGTGARKDPDLLERHSTPRTALRVMAWSSEGSLIEQLERLGFSSATTCIVARKPIASSGVFLRVSVMPKDPGDYARALYAEWFQCDAAGARLIVVEAPPEHGKWRAIWDRLRRASTRQE